MSNSDISRRGFLMALAAGLAFGTKAQAEQIKFTGQTFTGREANVRKIRDNANKKLFAKGFPKHRNNNDEKDFNYLASYSKYLPHNDFGEVERTIYRQYLHACRTGTYRAWEAIELVGVGKLKNPMAGVAYDLQAYDSQQLRISPAPKINSAESAAEMVELYWAAFTRDLHFDNYESSVDVQNAVNDLNRLSNYKAPKNNNLVTSKLFLRSGLPDADVGPYLSQLLMRDIPAGSLLTNQMQETVQASSDYLTEYSLWLAAQNGKVRRPHALDSQRRYIRNARDLSHYVHIDRLIQAYFNAALIIQFRLVPNYDFQFGANAPFDSGHPYLSSVNMQGFATFDYPHLLTLVSEVTTRALKAAWFQKWYVHRRIRPEEYGGLVHNQITAGRNNPVHAELLNSAALTENFTRYGSYLLSQAYFEGCPAHPAYPSGHAVVSGACATILKAWFDESYVISDPKVVSSDGLSLSDYSGTDVLTLGGEINKLAWNIAFGRCLAGVHWRSDAIKGLKLGEKIALSILESQKHTYREKFSFTIKKFDGTTVVIKN